MSPRDVFSLAREALETSIPARFRRVVAAFPDHVALTGDGRSWTYRQLDGDTDRLAHAIHARAGAGGCIAFLAEQGPLMVLTALAVLKTGRAYVALHPRQPEAAHARALQDLKPALLVATADERERARALDACALLIDDGGAAPTDAPPLDIAISPDAPAAIFYTSGSTGKPKGVVKSHRAVLHRTWLAQSLEAVTPEDRVSLLSHASFAASEFDLFGALLFGARAVVFDLARHGFAELAEWLEAERPTLLHPPVLVLRRFLASLERTQRFRAVRAVALAGDIVTASDVEMIRRHFAPECVLFHRFSSTETALLKVARFAAGDVLPAGPVHAGASVPDKLVALIGDDGRPVPPGETGAVVVQSAYLADGYWGDAAATAAAFEPVDDHPRIRSYRTGDLARLDADGNFIFVGRRDHQVKVRGYRVDLREIESALLELPEVSEAAVVAAREGEETVLLATVAPAPGGTCAPASLRDQLRARLPDWKVPARITVRGALPITLTGKVDRRGLDLVHPVDQLEDALISIFEFTLSQRPLGTHDNFFDLGGHSVDAARLVSRIEDVLGFRIPMSVLFESPTVLALARTLRRGAPDEGFRRLVPIRPDGARPPLYVIHPADGHVLGYADLARHLPEGQPVFGIQARGLDGRTAPHASVSEMARDYVDLVRGHRPGPYLLAGWSAGGLIAHEMARRLVDAGSTVPLVVLIDAGFPRADAASGAHRLLHAARAPERLLHRLAYHRKVLATLPLDQWSGYIGTRLRTLTDRALVQEDRALASIHVLRRRVSQINRAHAVLPYPGRTLYVRSHAGHPSWDRPWVSWRRVNTGSFQLEVVPGEHHSMMLPPNVAVLADRIMRAIEKALVPDESCITSGSPDAPMLPSRR